MRLAQLGSLLVLHAFWVSHALAAYNFSVERIRELQDEIQLLEAKRSPENEKHLLAKRSAAQLAIALNGALQASPCDDEDFVKVSSETDLGTLWSNAGTDVVLAALIQYWQSNEPAVSEFTVMVAEIYSITDSTEFTCSVFDIYPPENSCQSYDISTACDATYGWSKNQLLTSFRNLNNYIGGLYSLLQDVKDAADSLATALTETFVKFQQAAKNILDIFEEILGIALIVIGAATFVFGGAALDAVGSALLAAKGVETAIEKSLATVGKSAAEDSSKLTKLVDGPPSYEEATGTGISAAEKTAAEEKISAEEAAEKTSAEKKEGDFALAEYYKREQNRYGFLTQAEALATQAGMILDSAKDVYATYSGYLQEAQTYVEWANITIAGWGSQFQSQLKSIFSGTMPFDTIDSNGRSNHYVLDVTIGNGAWLQSLSTNNVMSIALKTFLKFAIPTLLLQNTKVRPVIVMQPYACTDKAAAKKTDSKTYNLWSDMFASFSTKAKSNWMQASVSLEEYEDVCFFVVDANKDETGIASCTETRVGCGGDDPKRLKLLPGFVNSNFHSDGTGPFLSLELKDWVKSVYEGWLNNGRKNGVPEYSFAEVSEDSDPKYIFKNADNQTGIYNSFFPICGSDNATDYTEVEDSLRLIFDNILAAGKDWSTRANYSSEYPCNPKWKNYSKKFKRESPYSWPSRLVRRHIFGQQTHFLTLKEGEEL